jgi:fibronectin-binding autotransporter adhesin
MKPKKSFSGMHGILTVCLCFYATAQAQSLWNGTSSSDWANPANWQNGEVPPLGGGVAIANSTGGSNVLTLDTSRTIGPLTFGTTGTRTSSFALNTQATNALELLGGINAGGAFPTNAAFTMRGHYSVGAAQVWNVGGSGADNSDQGLVIREITTGVTNRGSLNLAADLTKTGTGQLMLLAIDVTGPGNLIIDQGTLKLNAGANQPLVLGGPGNISVNNNSVLAIYRNSGPLTLTRAIEMNDTASLVLRAGIMEIGSDIAFNGTHTVDSTANGPVLTGSITGAGTINRIGAGTVTLTGSLAGFTGTLNLNGGITSAAGLVAGSVNVGPGAALHGSAAVAGNLSLNNGGFSAAPGGSNLSTAGDVSLAGVNRVAITSSVTDSTPFTILNYSGTLAGNESNLGMAGGNSLYRNAVFNTATPGEVTLSLAVETKTWAGGGTWDVGVSDNWSGGTDQRYYQFDSVVFGEAGAGSVAITGVLTPSAITIEGASNYTFTGNNENYISGPTGIVKNGSGITTLGGVNTFTGGVVINGGVLRPSNNQALGVNGQLIVVNAGGTLDFAGTNTAARDYRVVVRGTGVEGQGALTNSAAGANANGVGSLTLAADASVGGVGRIDIRPIVAGTGVLDLGGFTLTKSGTNILSIVDSNALSDGSINVNAGVLGLTRSNVEGGGAINVNAGGQLFFENNSVPVSISKAIHLDGGISGDSTATLRVAGNAIAISSPVDVANKATFLIEQNLTLTGPLSGSGTILKTGAASLILKDDNPFAGEIQVSAGTITFDHDGPSTFGGQITGAGGVVKQGAGVLTLAAGSSYTGTTAINGGTLQLGTANALPTAGNLTFANTSGANLDLAGFDQEVRTLAGGGTAGGNILNTADGLSVLTLQPTGSDGPTYSGAIHGNIRLEVVGSKTSPGFVAPRQRLANPGNTFTGGVVVDGATLMVSSDGTLGAVPSEFQADNIILRNHGTLLNQVDGTALTIHANRGITLESGGGALVAGFNQNVTVHGTISGGADDTLSILPNNMTVILTANNTYAGDTLLTAATSRLQIGAGGLTGTLGSGDVVNNGLLTFNRSNDLSYEGEISGTGSVTQAGVGTLVLNGNSTYTGVTTVSAGTLLVNGSLATPQLTIANGATLGGAGGSIAGTVTTLGAGAILSPCSSPGTLSVGNLNVVAGGTFDFELGTVSDLLVVANEWTAGAGDLTFNFSNSGGFRSTTYTLVEFGSQSGLSLENLVVGSLPEGWTLDTTFGTEGWSIGDNSLEVRFIPEPSTALLGTLGLLAVLRRRRTA